jgi:hypothetical protein
MTGTIARWVCTAGVLVPALAIGCGSAGHDYILPVGSDDAGGGGFAGGDAAASNALDASIEQNGMTVKIVTLSCSGDCASVEAVATGGHLPYSFAWEDGSTNPSRRVCPTATTGYHVTVTDTGTGGEVPRPAQSVSVPLTADVLTCTDASATGACMPGTYAGMWSSVNDAGPYEASSGALTFALVSPVDGGDAIVPSGSTSISWALIGSIVAHFTGGLDCATGAFKVEDPAAAFSVAGVSAGTCAATFTGTLAPGSATISGEYSLVGCSNGNWIGIWQTTRTP